MVDAVGQQVPVLHGYEVDRVVARAEDVAAFDVNMLGLVDLQRLSGLIPTRQARTPNQKVIAALAVDDITAARAHAHSLEVEVAQVEEVERRQGHAARALGRG